MCLHSLHSFGWAFSVGSWPRASPHCKVLSNNIRCAGKHRHPGFLPKSGKALLWFCLCLAWWPICPALAMPRYEVMLSVQANWSAERPLVPLQDSPINAENKQTNKQTIQPTYRHVDIWKCLARDIIFRGYFSERSNVTRYPDTRGAEYLLTFSWASKLLFWGPENLQSQR